MAYTWTRWFRLCALFWLFSCGGSDGEDSLATAPEVEIVAGDKNCTLSWEPVDGGRSYRVYKASFSPVPVDADEIAVQETSYLQTGLNNGAPAYFVVYAEGKDGDSLPSTEVSCIPRSVAGPLMVRGNLVWDSGEVAAGVEVKVEASFSKERGQIEWLEEIEGTTDLEGSFALELTKVQRPTHVRASFLYEPAGGAPAAHLQRWFSSEEAVLDTGKSILVDPVANELTITAGSAASADATVELSNLPPEIARVFARGFDPNVSPEAFPGDFSEEGGMYLRSYSFAWIVALDSAGNPIHDLSAPATLRLRVQPAHYTMLRDYDYSTERIEMELYSYDEEGAVWLQDGAGWLQDKDGQDLDRDDLGALRRGSYPGEVYVTAEVRHFSYYNLDVPCIGPWPLGGIPAEIRNTECTRDAIELANAILQTDLGANSFADVNKDNQDVRDELPLCSAPMPRPVDFGEEKIRGKYSESESDYIDLNNRFWGAEGCNNADPEQALIQKCSMGLTLLHETAHWKHHVIKDDGVPSNETEVGGEAGRWQEKELFGVNVYGKFYYKYSEGGSAGTPQELSTSQLSRICNKEWWTEEHNAGTLNRATMQEIFPTQAPSSQAFAEEELRLSLSADATDVPWGSPISLTVSVHNDDSQPAEVLPTFAQLASPISFEIVENSGRKISYRGGKIWWDVRGDSFISLAPGDSVSTSLALPTTPGAEERYDFLPGHSYQLTALYLGFFGSKELRSAPVTITIGAGPIVSGIVTDSETGSPIPNAVIELSDASTLVASTFSRADGAYQVAAPQAGPYSLRAASYGYESAYIGISSPSLQDIALTPFAGLAASGEIDFAAEGITLRGVALRGNVLYGFGLGGLAAYDLSNPDSPVPLWTYPGDADVGVQDVEFEDSRLYFSELGNINVLDLSVPTSPSNLGSHGVTHESFAVESAIAYTFNVSFSDVIDMSNPSSPQVLASPTLANASFRSVVAVTNTHMFVVVNNGDLQGFDMSTPGTPAPAGILPFGSFGDYVVDAGDNNVWALNAKQDGSGVIKVFNVTDPDSPSETWSVVYQPANASKLRDIAIDGAVLAVLVEDVANGNRVDVWDLSNPANPVLTGAIFTAGKEALALEAGKLVVAGETAVELFAISAL